MLRVRSSKNSRTRKPIGTESNSKVAYDCIGIVFCRIEIQIELQLNSIQGSNKINMVTLGSNMEWKIRKLWLYEHLINWSVAAYLFAEPIGNQEETEYRENFVEKYLLWDQR